MTTFAVTYTYDDRDDARAAVRPEHRAFLTRLLQAEVLLASGPVAAGTVLQRRPAGDAPAVGGTGRHVASGPDDTAAPAGALLLIRAASAEEALRVLDDDPFWREGFVLERSARSWDPVIGPWAG